MIQLRTDITKLYENKIKHQCISLKFSIFCIVQPVAKMVLMFEFESI